MKKAVFWDLAPLIQGAKSQKTAFFNPRKVCEWKGKYTEGQSNVEEARSWLQLTVVQEVTAYLRFDPPTLPRNDQTPKESPFPGHGSRNGDAYKLIHVDRPFCTREDNIICGSWEQWTRKVKNCGQNITTGLHMERVRC
jgi:hypothetical protein